MRILIAEDEQRTRQGLVRVLQSLRDEYEIVAQASNGKAALEMILEQKPDVVFIDIKMPFMDGLSVIEAARAQGIKAEFVIVSAYADFDFAKQSISLGVIEYLLKPLTRDEAEAVLKKIENKISGKNSYSRRKSRNLRDKYPDAHTEWICRKNKPEEIGRRSWAEPGIFQLSFWKKYRRKFQHFSKGV